MLIAENRWRAMRFGPDASLLDLARGELVPFAELLEELLEILKPDATALDCAAELAGLREIVRRGTSAHRQLGVYAATVADGASHDEALRAVTRWLVEETACF
jgi:carboxylate-amine ligase